MTKQPAYYWVRVGREWVPGMPLSGKPRISSDWLRIGVGGWSHVAQVGPQLSPPPCRRTRQFHPLDWILSDDAGLSSATIWAVMMGVVHPRASLPYDPSDFGRCHRLLQHFPEWRPRLREVARKHPEWRELVRRWDELVALYEAEAPSGTAPRLYHELQHIREAALRRLPSSTGTAHRRRRT